MKKKAKIATLVIIAIALVISSIAIFKNNNKIAETEILVSQNYEQVQEGDEKIDGTDYVKFDAFYLRDLDGDGYAEKLRGTCKEIGKEDTLYMDLSVIGNGKLKDGTITINGKNFFFNTTIVKSNIISDNYINNDTKEIKLNELENGTQTLLFGSTRSGIYNNYNTTNAAIKDNINNYHATDNEITLTGIHVADDGTETEISKTIYLTNDWYGTTRATVNYWNSSNYQSYIINNVIDEENQKVNLFFYVYPGEEDKKLIIDKCHFECEIPQLNGYDPLNVYIQDDNDAEFEYDSESRIFKFVKSSVVDEEGNATTIISRYIGEKIIIEYPYEAYESLQSNYISIDVPVKAYFEGYNNTLEEFENPYKSNIATNIINVVYKEPPQRSIHLESRIGKSIYGKHQSYGYYISKELPAKIYNNLEVDDEDLDEFKVRWRIYSGLDNEDKIVVIKDNPDNYSDTFLNKDREIINAQRYISNVGIYFEGEIQYLDDDGYIRVYNDETNELIHEFAKNEIRQYSESNPYKYDEEYKHIRVELSEINKDDASLYIYNVKKIDDLALTTDFTKEEFDNLEYITTHTISYVKDNELESVINTYDFSASYSLPRSNATISFDSSNFSNQETVENFKITIDITESNFMEKKWKDGVFLIQYPKEIIDVVINSASTSDENVKITGVDTYDDGEYVFTKIYTANDVEKSRYNIVLDANITADPRSITVTTSPKLYCYNPLFENYSANTEDIYDVNDNSKIDDNVGMSHTFIKIYSPLSLLINQDASEFDELGSVIVAPREVEVDKEEDRTAKINVNLTNNYSSSVSEIKIIGKVPKKDNKSQLLSKDLGSTYDTEMTEDGIIVPDGLKEYVTVYYSEKDDVTPDITLRKNGWTVAPEDMSKVKSYMIDLGNYVMAKSLLETFSYVVSIPNNLNYNDISYSTSAVYYCLDTNEGKLKAQNESNKLGIRIAKRYNFQISNIQKNTDRLVSSNTFAIQEVGKEESKISVTNSNGVALFKKLYVDREYVIKEIKSNDNYVLDEKEIKFVAHVVDGQIQIDALEGNFDSSIVIENGENISTAKATIESEVKYNVEMNKIQYLTNEELEGIRFELKDYKQKVKKYMTSRDGKLYLKLLEPYKQYTLTEIKSNGHYYKDPVTFMMIRDENNNLKFNVVSGEFDGNPVIDMQNEVPNVVTELVNEKIPEYSLRITKKENEKETVVQGAQYSIEGLDKNSNLLYETDEQGQTIIGGLYQYIDGKGIDCEYTLKEVFPSEGYVLNEVPVKFKLINDNGTLRFNLISGNIREEIENVQIDITNPDNPIVDITMEGEPVFTLTKVDSETNEPLEGVVFDIQDLNGNSVRDSNGNLIGYEELANIELISTGNYQWTENEDNIWVSGNKNVPSSTSVLKSQEFEIDEDGVLSFDWCVSSEAEDYLYYKITNLDSDETIGGITTEISGTASGTKYENLKFETAEKDIQTGRYIIEFYYVKNDNNDSKLDSGYVKNIKVTTKEKGVKTDKDGTIRLSLKEGLYKAVETKPLEGYSVLDNYVGIGIGQSKKAEYGGLKFDKQLSFSSADFKDVVPVDGGFIAVTGVFWTQATTQVARFDSNGNEIWENTDKSNYYFQDITLVPDGVIVVGYDYHSSYSGVIVKYDMEGNIEWDASSDSLLANNNQLSAVTTVEDGIIAINSTSIVKCDFSGNVLWNKKNSNYSYSDVVGTSDGFIVVCNYGTILKYDLDGNLIWENIDKKSDTYGIYGAVDIYNNEIYAVGKNGGVAKYDIDGNFIWENTDKNYYYVELEALDDGVVATTRNGVVIKFDKNGNIVWENDETNNRYYGITKVNDGFVAVSYCGISVSFGEPMSDDNGPIVKFDFDGNLLWENYDKVGITQKFIGHIELEDGYIEATEDSVKRFDSDSNEVWSYEDNNSYEKIYFKDDYLYVIYYRMNEYYANNKMKILKLDLDGNFVSSFDSEIKDYISSALVDEGIIIVANNYYSTWTTIDDYEILKYDFEGNLIWKNDDKNYIFRDIALVNDGFIVISESGHIVKYDYSGNLIWDKEKESYSCEKIISTDEGIYIGEYIDVNNGRIVKYDFDGDLIWEKDLDNVYKIFLLEYEGNILYTHNKDIVMIDYYGEIIHTIQGANQNLISLTKKGEEIIGVSTYGLEYLYKANIDSPEIVSSQNVVVKNDWKRFNITTTVLGNGGNISGKNKKSYEEVKYKEDSTKDIIVTPYAGYTVKNIFVNGVQIPFEENSDGTVILDKFYDMEEDKHVEVSFAKKSTGLTINKLDSFDLSPISDVKFNINQIEDREEPVDDEVFGELVLNGDIYYSRSDGEEVTDVIENIENGEEYYFVDNGNGGYESNNIGVDNSLAYSCFKVDLSDKEGSYKIRVNANVSSANSDVGYVTIMDDTTKVPEASYGFRRFMYISGTGSQVTTPRDYTYVLDGGKTYYLYLGYYKDGSGSSGEDKFTVNSIKLYNLDSYQCGFVKDDDGKYKLNDNSTDLVEASSYIPIDLSSCHGKYTITLNANIQNVINSNYGYLEISTSNKMPDQTSRTYFTKIDRNSEGAFSPQDYSVVVEGGELYYLHLCYYYNSAARTGEDFIINNIDVSLNQDGFVNNEEIITNANGKAIINLNEGRYEITETETKDGYILDNETITYDFKPNQENKLTINNNRTPNVVVHHYLKDTTTKVAEDEKIMGNVGEYYTTLPKTDLEKYELIKTDEGNYDVPENAAGTFEYGTKEVTYYYELKKYNVIVHHYIDGTQNSVVPDETITGMEGERYETNSLDSESLDERYELVQDKLPYNASGTFSKLYDEVTYYYRLKSFDIKVQVDNDGIGGTVSSLEETVRYGEDSTKDIVIQPTNGHYISKILINDQEQELPDDTTQEYTLPRFANVTENKNVVVLFDVIKSNISVNVNWNDNNNEANRRPEAIEVELYKDYELLSTIRIDESNDWNNIFENMPMYDEEGNEINYSVKEKEINSNDLEFYSSSVEKIDNKTFNIVTTFLIPDSKVDIKVTLDWEDDETQMLQRPEKVKIVLKNGDEVIKELIVDTTGGKKEYIFSSIPYYDESGNEINYTIDELEINDGDLRFYSKQIDQENMSITNTYTIPDEKINIDIPVRWNDNSNENNTRPNQIKLQVKNGDEIVQEQVFDVEKNAEEKVYTFVDLPKYDDNGEEIEYTINEVEVNEKELEGYEQKLVDGVVVNELRKYKIYTSVQGIGGTISGSTEEYYEEVIYGSTSIKDIVIEPNEQYQIKNIKINDVEQNITGDKRLAYMLPKFETVTGDINIIVEFEYRTFNITTSIENGKGTISGSDENPYEVVTIGNDSTKDITINAEYGYEISKIKVNNEEIEFTINEDGTYTLPKFTNVQEDKNVTVTFELKDSKIIVKHILPDEVLTEELTGKVGEEYSILPKDIEGYNVVMDKLPDNYSGVYTEDIIEVTFYYERVENNEEIIEPTIDVETSDINVAVIFVIMVVSISGIIIVKKGTEKYYK